MTNFEKRWARFFTLCGWRWQYFPEDHRYKTVRPDFRVVIPHTCSECSARSRTLDVFLRRILRLEAYGEFWNFLQFLRQEANVSRNSPVQPALFCISPRATLLDTEHAGWSIVDIDDLFLPANWKSLWSAARALTCYSVAQPVGGLR